MPQLNTVVLKDGDDASHSFVPSDITNGVATLIEGSGIPIGENRYSVALVRTAQGRRKVTLKLALPVVQNSTINGVDKPTVVRTAYADVTFSFDQTSNQDERDDCRGLLASALADPMTKAVIADLQNLY